MNITFSKMHGLGNDFVVIDGVNQCIDLDEAQRRLIADRHLGVGCNQILLLEQSNDPQHDFVYRIFNADGGEVEQCGNGARCVMRFALDNNLTNKESISLATSTGNLTCKSLANGDVCVDMGAPNFSDASLPFDVSQTNDISDDFAKYQITFNDSNIEFATVSMGNPHAVVEVSDSQSAAVAEQGAYIGAHPAFPNGVNVGFMQRVNGSHIKLRVFERGAGETLACGTGACAAVAVGIRNNVLANKVTVDLRGGQLQIEWSGHDSDSLFMSGPAETVFNGKMTL